MKNLYSQKYSGVIFSIYYILFKTHQAKLSKHLILECFNYLIDTLDTLSCVWVFPMEKKLFSSNTSIITCQE